MKRAVSVTVTAIDSDYGFTLLYVSDRLSGKRLAQLHISDELTYVADSERQRDVEQHMVSVEVEQLADGSREGVAADG